MRWDVVFERHDSRSGLTAAVIGHLSLTPFSWSPESHLLTQICAKRRLSSFSGTAFDMASRGVSLHSCVQRGAWGAHLIAVTLALRPPRFLCQYLSFLQRKIPCQLQIELLREAGGDHSSSHRGVQLYHSLQVPHTYRWSSKTCRLPQHIQCMTVL